PRSADPHPRDHEPHRVPGLPRQPDAGQRLPVAAVPRDRVHGGTQGDQLPPLLREPARHGGQAPGAPRRPRSPARGLRPPQAARLRPPRRDPHRAPGRRRPRSRPAAQRAAGHLLRRGEQPAPLPAARVVHRARPVRGPLARPPRARGGAGHRRQARHRWLQRREVSAQHHRPPHLPVPLGCPLPARQADAMTATLEEARQRDAQDPLRDFRDQFLFPTGDGDAPWLYFTGNSLGLQPKSTRAALEQELDAWARLGVKGHFNAEIPWYSYHEPLLAPMARVVGAQPHEVALMNGLTTNLHLLMVSFYRPTDTRHRIVSEQGASPSDRYAVSSQARFHGHDPSTASAELSPRDGVDTLRADDLEAYVDPGSDPAAA